MIVNKIAVIGSREGFTYEEVNRILVQQFTSQNATLITGGARGVDNMALKFAKDYERPYKVIRPINPANKLDYLFRNVEIITLANKIIVFWDGKSRGTKFVIDYAKARHKDIVIIIKEC